MRVKYSAIILSGGESSRFGVDKGLFKVFQKPLISFVIKAVKPLCHEVIIVTSNPAKAAEYSSLFPLTRILIDELVSGAPIVGVFTGLKYATGEFSFLLPSDTPLLSEKVLRLLQKLSHNYNAVIPRWPSGYIEPLHAIYRTKLAYNAVVTSLQNGNLTLQNMISKLQRVLYLSTQILKQYDPQLLTFHNINHFDDLQKITHYLK